MSTEMKGKRRTNAGFEDSGLEEFGEEKVERESLLEPLKVLKKDDRRIGIFKRESRGTDAYFLLEIGEKEVPGCHTIDYSSLKLAEKEARSLLAENEDVMTGRDAGFCATCEGRLMESCDDFKTNRIVETITERKEGS